MDVSYKREAPPSDQHRAMVRWYGFKIGHTCAECLWYHEDKRAHGNPDRYCTDYSGSWFWRGEWPACGHLVQKVVHHAS